METLMPYAVPAGFALFFAWRWFRFRQVRNALPGLLAQGARVLDVRTRAEFAAGHAPGSINIPLDELGAAAPGLDKAQTVLVCCASGTRGALAVSLLRKQGFRDARNAGSWRNLC